MKNTIDYFSGLIDKQKSYFRHDSLTVLKDIDSRVLAEIAGYYLIESLDLGVPVVATCIIIGREVSPDTTDTEDLLRIGYTLLHTLCKAKMIEITRGSSFKKSIDSKRSKLFAEYKKSINSSKKKGDRSPSMFDTVNSDEARQFILELSNEVQLTREISQKSLIHNEVPEEWNSFEHEEFGDLISNANRRVRRYFNRDTQKVRRVFRAVNKIQSTPLQINSDVLQRLIDKRKVIIRKMYEDAGEELTLSYLGKYRLLERIIALAKDNVGKEVYSAIFLDFRGRVYYGANYLNRSGCDWAKGLLCVLDGDVLGEKGWNNLIVGAVDFRDKDKQSKLPKAQKLDIADDDLDEFIRVGRGECDSFLDADEPAQYLAVCIDIAHAVDSGNEFEAKTVAFLSRDASQSGPQLMGLATQDYNTLLYTNLLDVVDAYDLYTELGREMRKQLSEMQLSGSYKGVRIPEDEDLFNQVLFLHRNKEALLNDAAIKFLELFEDDKVLRDWAKYPTMLIGYSAEEMCVAEDLWNKFQDKTPWLTPVGCKMISDIFYKAYEKVLPACWDVMRGFKKLGGIVHGLDDDLVMFGSYSGFPHIQDYWKYETIEVNMRYFNQKWPKTFCYRKRTDKRSYHDTVSGTPANTVHSWDKELIFMAANRADFDIAVNHDAYFATAANIDKLDALLRDNIYELGTQYDLLGDSLQRYDITPEELGITVNELQPEFRPQNNEFCFA